MLVPMASPELPSATSYAVVLLASPVCLAVLRDPLVSRRAQAGAGRGPRHVLGCASACFAGRRVFPGRTSSWLGFPFCFVLFFFTDLSTDSKMYISWLVDPNDVVPILLSPW